MSNLIDANELYIRIRKQVKSPAIVGCLGGIIAEMPTFGLDDLRPHGRWVISCDGYYPYCSNCKEEPESGDMTPFCPNCGAKMDLEDAHGQN